MSSATRSDTPQPSVASSIEDDDIRRVAPSGSLPGSLSGMASAYGYAHGSMPPSGVAHSVSHPGNPFNQAYADMLAAPISVNLPLSRPSTPSLDMIGRVLGDRYVLERILGEGGMGVVYLGYNRHVQHARVAIKVLRADMAQDDEITTRFFNEAKAASSIGSPHIVDVSDYGVLSDRTAYFVMEYLDGISLADAERQVGVFPLLRMLHVARQIARGLKAAHDIGVVHRDLKPENIMLVNRNGDADFVKILDFGIAKVGSQSSRLTRAGSVFGTPQYMSPEQAAGVPVDHRSDVYSLGILLFEMASGRVPFDNENVMTVLSQHMFHNLPPLRTGAAKDLPSEFEAIVKKCLSKKVETRYASMADVITDLDALEMGLPTHASAELARDSERFAAPTGFLSTRPNTATVTNLTAPSRKPSYIFPLLGVAAAAALAVLVGLAIIFKVRAAADETMAARNASSLDSLNGQAGAIGAASAPSSMGAKPVDVRVSVEPKTTVVMQGDVLVWVDNGTFTLHLHEGESARIQMTAPGFEPRDATVSSLTPQVAFKLDPAHGMRPLVAPSVVAATGTTKRAPQAIAPHGVDVAAPVPPVAPKDGRARCKTQGGIWDGYSCL